MFTTKNFFTLVGKHIIIAMAFVVVTIGIIFVLSKQISKISLSEVKNRHLATALSERTALLSNLKHETEIVGANDIIIKNAFIPASNILDFVSVLENLALKNGVTQAFHFGSPLPNPIETPFPTAIITYQNTLTSNVTSFIGYLREFEKLPYFTKIDSLSISSSNADWRTSATVSFSATVLAQPAQ